MSGAFQFPGLGSSRLPRTQSSGLQSSWSLSSCSGISGICICCFVTNGVYTRCSGSDSSETPAGTTWTGPSSLVRSELHRRHILHFLAYEFLVLQEAVEAYLWPQTSNSSPRVAFWSTTTFLWVLVLTLQVRISEFTATFPLLFGPKMWCNKTWESHYDKFAISAPLRNLVLMNWTQVSLPAKKDYFDCCFLIPLSRILWYKLMWTTFRSGCGLPLSSLVWSCVHCADFLVSGVWFLSLALGAGWQQPGWLCHCQ